MRLDQRQLSNIVLPIAFVVGVFLVWEAACRMLQISTFVLPAPSDFLPILWTRFDALWLNARETAFTTLIGFGIGTSAGLLLGGITGSSPALYNALYPTLIGFNSLPKVALVPVFVVWLGFGTLTAVLTAAVTCMFPVLVVVATSIATTEPELNDVLRSLGARRMDVLVRVSIPRAMPQFFGSVNLAIVAAFIGTIIAEMVAANKGLGYVMVVASGNLDVPLVFAGLILLSAMGVVLYVVSTLFERRMTAWAYRGHH